MRRKIGFFVFCLTAIFELAACGRLPDCASEKVFCAGLVTDTLGIDDHGINQDTWTGLHNLTDYGIVQHADYIESVDTRDYEKNIAYFAARDYDIIITSGIGLRKATQTGAQKYPKIVFVGINQPLTEEAPRNLIPIIFPEDQMGFLAGIMAARLTKTNITGAVCENSDLEAMWKYCEGFRSGAKFAGKDIRVLIIYRNDGEDEKMFLDEEWGYTNATTLLQNGADVIFAAGGITAQGALRAAVESHALAIGAERDQAAALDISNEWIVTSIYGDAQFEVEETVRGITGENLAARNRSSLKFIPLSPQAPEQITPELQSFLVELWQQHIKTNIPLSKP